MATVVKGVFTSPIVLSGYGQASDGVAVLGAGERWLVTANAHNNGLWETAAGAWTRAPELSLSSHFVWGAEQTIVRVKGGNRYPLSEWAYNGVDNPTLGADTLYFEPRFVPRDEAANDPLTSYIEGLELYYVDDNTVGISPGRAYVPGLGKVLTVESGQTAMVPGGVNVLYYGYLEEYPAGSGDGRLRLITTEPGAPYLGSAATQLDDATARYLGILRKDNAGKLIQFEDEVLGGSTVFRLYNGSWDSAAVGQEATSETVQYANVGAQSPVAAYRLVGPGTRTVYMMLKVRSTTSGVPGNAFLSRVPFPANPTFVVDTHIFRAASLETQFFYAFARLDESQRVGYRAVAGGSNNIPYLAGYYESR